MIHLQDDSISIHPQHKRPKGFPSLLPHLLFLPAPLGEVFIYERALPPRWGVVIVNLDEFGFVVYRRNAGAIPSYGLLSTPHGGVLKESPQ